MGWFRRSAGRHSYGVPVIPAPPAARVTPALPPVSLPVPPPPPPPPPAPPMQVPLVLPSRLPDNRSAQQIGGKVAEVLWGYYGQQGAPGTPLTSTAVVPMAASPAYDDAYADTLLAEPTYPLDLFVPPAIAPVHTSPAPSLAAAPTAPAAPVAAFAVVPAATAMAPAPAPALPPRPAHVVQLGFVDGSTMNLAGDHPAAKALRAAADALTLRD